MNTWEVLINLFITLIGTFVGVYLAFWLGRRQQEVQAMKRYADALNAARRDLANLGSHCREIAHLLTPFAGWETIPPLEAPVVDAVRINPSFHEHAHHGLVICFTVIVTLRGKLQYDLDHAKSRVHLDISGLVQLANQMIRVIDFVQIVLDEEVKLLNQPVLSSTRDTTVIEGLEKAMKGASVQAPARPS
jgi:hypothetical protein